MMDITAQSLIVIGSKSPTGQAIYIERYALEFESETTAEIDSAVKALKAVGFTIVAQSEGGVPSA